MSKENNDANSLGKGEVVSSILPGSTRKPSKSRRSVASEFLYQAELSRTEREDDKSTRGKSVDSDRALFTMRDRLAKVVRNERDPLLRFRHNILLESVKGLISDPDPARESMFRQNARDFEAFMAGRMPASCQ